MSKVILTGYIQVPKDDLDAVMSELPNHVRLTREEPGCVAFNATRSDSDGYRFDIYEEFVDKEAFERHQTRTRASDWGRIAANVERFFKIEDESES